MSGNGNLRPDVAHAREAVRRYRGDDDPPKFAEMSSQQRSASMDATVRQVADLTRANNELHARLLAHADRLTALDSHEDRIDVLERVTAGHWLRSLSGRLRWLWRGVR